MSKKKTVTEIKLPDIIEKQEFKNVIDYAFTKYAFKVIEDRAIPDARDGLKPSQRRVLYAMDQLGLAPTKKHMKCAKIVGECFVAGTLVSSSEGLVPIENIQVDDLVYTQNGLKKVTAAYIMPPKPLLSIEMEDGRRIDCTEDQKFKIIDQNLEYVWKKASELTSDDYLVNQSSHGESSTPIFVNDLEINENLSYLLGFFLADGWISRDKKRGYNRVTFGVVDKEILVRIQNILNLEFGISCKIENRKNIYMLRINKKEVNEKLILCFNLLDKYAHNISVPDFLYRANEKIVYSFISGFSDGDGSVHKKRNVLVLTSISEQFLRKLQIILFSLRIRSNLYDYLPGRGSLVNGKNIIGKYKVWTLEISGNSIKRMAEGLHFASYEKKSRLERIKSNTRILPEKTDIIPYLGQKLIQEFSQHHLGGGWYHSNTGEKIRCGLKYANGNKIRYTKNLSKRFNASISTIISQNVLQKMKTIGSSYFEFTKNLIDNEYRIFFQKICSVTKLPPQVTYDIQVEKEHEFIANGVVVHNCMGNYHPHGDVSLYGTLVGMAQPWSMRTPLVDPQGNFGSIDGDSAAAQRYTEARLSHAGMALLEDLSPRVVTYKKNYDESRDEPTVLPAKLPNLLLNGGSGIAVGYATNIPPHNLKELSTVFAAYIKNNDISAREILQLMPGPDFPTGGKLLGQDGVLEYYETGRGSVKLEGIYEIESDNKTNDKIVITGFPEGGSPEKFRNEVKDLVEKNKIGGISDIANYSSNKIGTKVVVEVGRNGNAKVILNHILSHTCLRVSYSINNTVLIDGKLYDKAPIKLLIKAFVDHRQEVLTNKYNAELADANERIEVLEGLISVTNHIDAAIKIIRASENPESAGKTLIEKQVVRTERQAKAVLAITLAKLTKLEQNALLDEKNKKQERVKYLTKILSNRQEIFDIIVQEQKDLADKLGNDRRTLIGDQVKLINEADLIMREDVVVCITTDDCIKRVALKEYKKQNSGGVGVISANTSDDLAMQHMFSASTHDDLLCFTDTGRAFSIKVYELPEASRAARGRPIVNFINLRDKERVCAYLPVKSLSKSHLFLNFISKNGYVKRSAIRHYSKIDKSGVIATKIKSDDKIVGVVTSNGSCDLLFVSHQGMAIRINEADLNIMGRNSQGVTCMKLAFDDYVVNGISIPMSFDDDGHPVTIDKTLSLLSYTNRGYGKRTLVDQYLIEPTDGGKLRSQSRGGKGRIDMKHDKRTGKTVGALMVSDDKDLVIITKQGQMVRIPAESISVIGRNTSGVKMVKLADNDEIVATSAVAQDIVEIAEID